MTNSQTDRRRATRHEEFVVASRQGVVIYNAPHLRRLAFLYDDGATIQVVDEFVGLPPKPIKSP